MYGVEGYEARMGSGTPKPTGKAHTSSWVTVHQVNPGQSGQVMFRLIGHTDCRLRVILTAVAVVEAVGVEWPH